MANPFAKAWDSFINWIQSLFWSKEMEVTLVGLGNSGKSTLVQTISGGVDVEDMMPTVGFNIEKIKKGNVTIKMWDLGGQSRFRSMWEQYCHGVNVIVWVVDGADSTKYEQSKFELHELLSKKALSGIPLLVLSNKNDLPDCLGAEELIERMDLNEIPGRDVCCYSISAKERNNIDKVLEWLTKRAGDNKKAAQ